MIVRYMAVRLSFVSILLSICISISTIICCISERKPIYANNSSESNAFNIEKPGLFIAAISNQTVSPVVFLPEFITSKKQFFKFWLFKKLRATTNSALLSFAAKNLFLVVVSIHAP